MALHPESPDAPHAILDSDIHLFSTENDSRRFAGGQYPFVDAKAFREVLKIPGGYVNDHCLIHDGPVPLVSLSPPLPLSSRRAGHVMEADEGDD